MKKKIIIILGIWVILSTIFGFYYKKNSPKRITPKITPINSGAKAAKEPFKTVGMSAAKTSLKHKKPILTPFAKKMKEFGAENINMKIETNKGQFSKTLPPVIIGGKKYKNKTTCVIISFDYKEEQYEVGTCE